MAIKAHTCFMHLKGYCYSIPLFSGTNPRGDDGWEMRVGANMRVSRGLSMETTGLVNCVVATRPDFPLSWVPSSVDHGA